MQQQFRIELETKNGNEIADRMFNQWNNPAVQIACQAEFLRRQTEAQQEAAKAAVQTAKFTRASARYMLYSVVALVVSAILSSAVALLR